MKPSTNTCTEHKSMQKHRKHDSALPEDFVNNNISRGSTIEIFHVANSHYTLRPISKDWRRPRKMLDICWPALQLIRRLIIRGHRKSQRNLNNLQRQQQTAKLHTSSFASADLKSSLPTWPLTNRVRRSDLFPYTQKAFYYGPVGVRVRVKNYPYVDAAEECTGYLLRRFKTFSNSHSRNICCYSEVK